MKLSLVGIRYTNSSQVSENANLGLTCLDCDYEFGFNIFNAYGENLGYGHKDFVLRFFFRFFAFDGTYDHILPKFEEAKNQNLTRYHIVAESRCCKYSSSQHVPVG